MSIIDHLEKSLGKISQGWKDPDSNHSIQVVSFENQPFQDAVTYSTIGLSNQVLPLLENRTVRQELIFSAYRKYEPEQIASFLSTLGEYVLNKGGALLRGDLIGPSTPIIFGTLLNSVYATMPSVFNDSLGVYDETVPKTVLVWIIPLHEEEANYIRANGWSNFESLLEQSDPDLWDLARGPVV